MTVGQLKVILSSLEEHLAVEIKTCDPVSTVGINGICFGLDTDAGKIIIQPDIDVIKKGND